MESNGHSKSAAEQADELMRLYEDDDTVLDDDDLPEDDLFGGINPEIMTDAELDSYEQDLNYLVDDCVVSGQVGVFAGPDKVLKTSVMVDLALSIAYGKRFLGRYDVLESGKVGIFSCERGRASLKKLQRRIADAKEIRNPFGGRILWSYKPASITDPEWIRWLRNWIVENELRVLFLDPVYLMIPGMGSDTNNVTVMGEKVGNPLIDLAESTDCAIFTVNHFHKLGPDREFAEPKREMVSGAGWREMMRQWFLFNRFAPFDDRNNQIRLTIGSSEGIDERLVLSVDEGRKDARQWAYSVDTVDAAKQERAKQREETEDAERHEKALKVLDVLRDNPKGLTKSGVRKITKGELKTVEASLKYLEGIGLAEQCQVTTGNQKSLKDGWRASN